MTGAQSKGLRSGMCNERVPTSRTAYDHKNQVEANKAAIPEMAANDGPNELAADPGALVAAVSFLEAFIVMVGAELEVELDAPGALAPTVGPGDPDAGGLLAARAESGVTKATAVPDPPVMEKYVEKIGWEALFFAMNRMANFSVGERVASGSKVIAVATLGF